MKRILYISVLLVCVGAHYFVAREEMRRDESLLKVPPFVAVEHKVVLPVHDNPIVDASDESAKNALLPLLDSESVERAAELLKGVPALRAREIVSMIFKDEAFKISQLNKRLFVAAVAEQYKDAPAEQQHFLELLLTFPELHQGESLLETLIVNDYERAIPWVLRALDVWEKEKKVTLPEGLCSLVLKAYMSIIDKNDVHALSHLSQGYIPLDKNMASELLWRAAATPKADKEFVTLFVNKGANVAFAKDGSTVLMKAVANNNLPFVKALVEHKAPVDTMLDPAIGTALQLAVEKGFVAIELYLRSQGAQL